MKQLLQMVKIFAKFDSKVDKKIKSKLKSCKQFHNTFANKIKKFLQFLHICLKLYNSFHTMQKISQCF